MRSMRSGALWSKGIAVLCAAGSGVSGGCATMAHTVDPSGMHVRKTEKCDGIEAVCPWFAADFAWLLAGIIPGVVALAVDFGTGAWKHENLSDTAASVRAAERSAPGA